MFNPFLAGCLITILGIGSAIAQTADDRFDIIEASNSLDTAVDAKNWSQAESLFSTDIELTLPGQDTQATTAQDLVSLWATNLYEGKLSFHLRGNHVIEFSGANTAVLQSKAYAWNKIEGFQGGQLWEVWGDYEYDMVKTSQGWKIASFKFTPTHQRGNTRIPAYVPPHLKPAAN